MADDKQSAMAGPGATYAAETAALLDWYIGRDDVIDARQTGVYSIGVVLAAGDRLDVALQWRPPGEIGEASDLPEHDDVTVVKSKPVKPVKS